MNVLKVRDIVIGEGVPKIIVPLVGATEQALCKEVESLLKMKPDMFEWRADLYDAVEDSTSIERTLGVIRENVVNTPLLFTFRTENEGGKKHISLEHYREVLIRVISSGLVDLVDIELFLGEGLIKELILLAKKNGVFVVLSNHDFQRTPHKEELLTRFSKMQELGADIAKIAVMPNSAHDVITLLDTTQEIKENIANRPFITIAMGDKGVVSRLTGELFGSSATFASGVNKSAPGQIEISELRHILELLHQYGK
ncbi:type I 3-dehydroquinate dehydratase [Ornithinibacillus bavariensis]|uniref:3-dehydroquinate dehydratase n=1 Tax=Ornithinibacillus bavariensis TaxID=545502 RepID=A0A920C9P3_9BACI|nr:type I 3-dehydroquinate dehydratase [Ornithinibacillus bavariensis]GIO28707.1 3-dehydroquinate dehydratase [Ornithinibacillus bavariensis]